MKEAPLCSAETLLASLLTALALTGCSDPGPREDEFWVAYEQRLGMVGRDYADPVEAKAGSIRYGYFLCRKLAEGMDPSVLVVDGPVYSWKQVRVQLDTAVEFLCPQQG